MSDRPALLDVNLLIALFAESHVHHEIAHDWFEDHRTGGWATCATTENGFLRIVTNPQTAIEADRATVFRSLRTFCNSGHHRFWTESISLRDDSLFDPTVGISHRHVTDVYLLGLAVRNGGRLATFDRTIPLRAVKGATIESLAVIEPV